MFGRKGLEEKIGAMVRAEFSGIIAGLERDRRNYLRRLKLKEETQVALENAEAEAQRLYATRIALKKQFWEAYYQDDQALLSKIESHSKYLARAAKKEERAIEKARADFERADFDEVAEGFALKEKASLAEDEVNRRVETLEKSLKDLLTRVREQVREAARALREEYEEPHFETAEERDAYVKKTIEVLNTLAESHVPGK